MAKNYASYYRSVENLLNNSHIKQELPDFIRTLNIIDADKYQFENLEEDN